MQRALSVFVLALVVAACGAEAGSGSLPVPAPPTAALAKWKDFPAAANPRPIIAFGDAAEVIQPQGFPDGDRKVAWICNKFVPAAGLTMLADARRAYAALMSERALDPDGSTQCTTLAPFVVTAARLASAGFPTDRGTMQLRAWVFDVPEVGGFVAYLAVDPSALWGGAIVAKQGRGARVSQDGRTLKIGVINPGTGPCDSGRYTASAAESSSAVAVAVLRIPNPTPQSALCALPARIGFIEVSLNSPLRGRVLVDENGDVGTACPETGDC